MLTNLLYLKNENIHILPKKFEIRFIGLGYSGFTVRLSVLAGKICAAFSAGGKSIRPIFTIFCGTSNYYYYLKSSSLFLTGFFVIKMA